MRIDIDEPKIKFQDHLSKDGNNRLLFSGKFGTGKSYFLKEFFETQKDKYNVFWISPIHYVVGANQDIFEWIKVDLAKQLVTDFLPYKEEKPLTKNFLIQSYVYKNAGSIFEKLISVLSNEYLKVKTGVDFLDSFKKQIEEYKEFEQSSKEELRSDFEKLQSFLNVSFQIKGSIYEDDLTTQIIRVAIEVLKRENSKQNVLIVDDLDRLDPEHIFRILNILSVHTDHFDSNKFGFDKVILVCDFDGIEGLYKHKYGPQSDFDGYIEKFYTYEPFNFSIRDSIVNFCRTELKDYGLKSSTRNILALLLVFFYEEDRLRVRNLSKIKSFDKVVMENSNLLQKYQFQYIDPSYPFHYPRFTNMFSHSNSYEIDYSFFDIIKGIYLLSFIFGGLHKLSSALHQSNKRSNITFDEKYLSDIYEALCIPSHIGKNIRGNVKEIFMDLNDINGNNKPAGVLDMNYPIVKFFGGEFRLPLKWTIYDHYKEGNYFIDADPITGISQYSSEIERRKVCNISNLLYEVSNVVKLIIEERLFNNLKS